ncbi:MAG: hypothetical protein B7Y99_00140 [Caulobacterales bacterium 32-69-10]|nr:MAG: hypothetical protein B7Y99_00140 [Caulobacterales bacterium 32-69-10]
MSHEIHPTVLGVYRTAAREEPSERLDPRVLDAVRSREPTPLALLAQAAVALMIGPGALSALYLPRPPSPDDPRYFGLYVGREASVLLALARTPPDPIAGTLLKAGRPLIR